MPPARGPPTPASSTEIKGLDGSHALQMSFELPPPAVTEARPASASKSSSSVSSYHPTSPESPAPSIPASEAVKIRRRSAVAQTSSKDAFTLPPPPTRSRKIIQMKPRAPEQQPVGETEGSVDGKSVSAKKKQPSATSAAGRKMARKTAHSLIERRRRSKMNEEFGVLKDMIPACTGEMHKLAILQATIDYVRYLEDCVGKLKDENTRNSSTAALAEFELPPPSKGSVDTSTKYTDTEEEDEDVDMGNSDATSPTQLTPVPNIHQPSISPTIMPQEPRDRQNSYSSNSYGYNTSANTSPQFGPSLYDYSRNNPGSIGSALTSPALLPQRDRDLDHEATAALLMLNADRRGTHGSRSGRSMSVKDLLSG
ncbi:helix-loop-helix DNA-binding domain-containing protein [Phlyctema vagabunda]|uniref:Helix-loop-helix DNA-binding domain-containing protein n=1 Tax=Phlyctema vagabunda TaxID=108571 RepID=A0ABR4PXF7_9HELO